MGEYEPNSFPKIIWCAWFDGELNAPKHVQKIIQLWRVQNPEYDVRVLCDPDVDRILFDEGIDPTSLSPQVKSDALRLILLRDHGGVWVDATLLPTRPLRDWLEPHMVNRTLFAFNCSGDPDLTIQSWFLAARKESLLVDVWCKSFLDYFKRKKRLRDWKTCIKTGRVLSYLQALRKDRVGTKSWFFATERGRKCFFYPYMAICHQFSVLIRTDLSLAQEWDGGPNVWDGLPELIGGKYADRDTPDDVVLNECVTFLDCAPVHKLTHRDPRFLDLVCVVERNVQKD